MDLYSLCRKYFAPLLLLALTAGCFTTAQPQPSPAEPAVRTNLVTATTPSANHSYALIYDLLGDEKNVSKLLIIKRERLELKEVVKAISQTAGEAHKQLEKFGKADPTLNLKDKGLPTGETAARESISKAKAKELLTDKGKDFELKLLLSQNEALTYGEHLASTAAQKETEPQLRRFLQTLARDLGQLRHRVAAILAAHYTWGPDGK
jgi:hypothetical protein